MRTLHLIVEVTGHTELTEDQALAQLTDNVAKAWDDITRGVADGSDRGNVRIDYVQDEDIHRIKLQAEAIKARIRVELTVAHTGEEYAALDGMYQAWLMGESTYVDPVDASNGYYEGMSTIDEIAKGTWKRPAPLKPLGGTR